MDNALPRYTVDDPALVSSTVLRDEISGGLAVGVWAQLSSLSCLPWQSVVKRTVSIGALLVMIPFQVIDTRYASSSVLIAYVLAAALFIGGGLGFACCTAMGMIVLSYFASLALADRSMFIHHVRLHVSVFFLPRTSCSRTTSHCLSRANIGYGCPTGDQCSDNHLLCPSVFGGPRRALHPVWNRTIRVQPESRSERSTVGWPFRKSRQHSRLFCADDARVRFGIMFTVGQRRMFAWVIVGLQSSWGW